MTHTARWFEVAEAALDGLSREDEVVQLGGAYRGDGDLGQVPIVHIAYLNHIITHQLYHFSTVPVAIIVEGCAAGLGGQKNIGQTF